MMGLKREGSQRSLVTVDRALLWRSPEFHKLYFFVARKRCHGAGVSFFFAGISIVALPEYEKNKYRDKNLPVVFITHTLSLSHHQHIQEHI